MRRTTVCLALIAAFVFAGCASTTTTQQSSTDQPTAPTGATSNSNAGGQATTVQPTRRAPRVDIDQAGSSTVLPIAQAWAYEFGDDINANIMVAGGGSGAGISKFCKGEIDIADASRPIKSSEVDACRKIAIEPFEVQVAIDGLSVVVANSNTFVDCLTVSELYKIWTATPNRVMTWRALRPGANPAWPDEKIQLYGPGPESGTFDYWKEVIIAPKDGSTATTHSDFSPNEDDNALVTGVASSQYGLGYFGLAYFEKNKDKLNVLKIDDEKGAGCIEPTAANVESGKYTPLARPLFMYTNGKPAATLQAYFQLGLSDAGQGFVEKIGYIKLPASKLAEMRAKVA